MKTIISYERSTGAGARHGTQYRFNDSEEWQFVSDAALSARYVGRDKGFHIWNLRTIQEAQVREYHRSNSGTERIVEGRMLDGPRTELV